MYVIPPKDSKRFSQPNVGDTQGNLWSTYNMDLTKNLGRVRSTRCQNVFNEDDDAQLTRNTAFAFFDWDDSGDQVFVAYNGAVFFGGTEPTDTFTQDTLTNTPSATSSTRGDMKVFNNKLYVTTTNRLKELASGDSSWTNIHTFASSVSTHQLCVYGDRLYIVDESNKVISMNTAGTVVTTGSFTLDLSYFNGHISWIAPGSNRIWIGFTKSDGTRGLIFEWDGQSENLWSKNYAIEAQGTAGCAIWNDIPYVLDIEGRLLAFNGSYFEEVARLPILQYEVLQRDYATNSANKIVHYNGIRYINDAILMLVNSSNTGTLGEQESFPGGIYEYTKENGLVHKFSPSLTSYGDTSPSDYGAWYVGATGAIFDATARSSNTSSYTASVMFGAAIKNNGDNTWNAIFTDVIEPTIKQGGYFVTSWLESSQVTDVWKSIVLKYRKFLGENDKIVVKYRVTKDVPLVEQNAVWNTDTEVEVTGSAFSALEVGDEIEVIAGLGSGKCAHITAIVVAGSTYTLTLDDSVPGVSATDTSHVRFQKWHKLPDIIGANVQFQDLPIPQYNKDTQIQIKVVAEWTGANNEIRELIVVNNSDQNAK